MRFSLKFFLPRYWLIWMGLAVLCLISWLPTLGRHKLAKILSKFAYKHNHKRRNVILVNLKYCFPAFSKIKITSLTKQIFFYAMLGYVEYGIIIFGSKKRLQNLVNIEDLAYFEQLSRQESGVLILVAHTPLLEFFGPALQNFAYGDYYKKTKNALINYFIFKSRSRFVPSLVAREDGIGKIISPLKQRKMFYYPADEDLGEQYSVFVPFFASSKATLTTPSRISKITKCLCLPAIMVWDASSGKYTVKIQSPLENYPSADIETDAKQVNQALERLITPNIAQYMWSFKLFRTRKHNQTSLY